MTRIFGEKVSSLFKFQFIYLSVKLRNRLGLESEPVKDQHRAFGRVWRLLEIQFFQRLAKKAADRLAFRQPW